MKIKNTIVLIAIGIFGTISTQAKSNFKVHVNSNYTVQQQDPPVRIPFIFLSSADDDNGNGTILDPNPPLYDPPTHKGTGK